MNQFFSSDKALSFLNDCEDELDNSLNFAQLEMLCSSIIEKFLLYIEEHEFIKQQLDLKLKNQEEHIFNQNQQIQNYNTLIKELQEQIQSCLKFTEHLKSQTIQENKKQLEISRIESLLISKLANQNQLCSKQIETLSGLIQENYVSMQKMITKNCILKHKIKQLTQKNEEHELKIKLPNSLTINQVEQSFDDSILEEIRSCISNIEDPQNSQQNEKNSFYFSDIKNTSSQNSNSQTSSLDQIIIESSEILKETNLQKLKLKEKRILKENKQILSHFQSTQVSQFNPYEIFFKLIVQCVKLDIGKSEAFNLNLDQYYQIFQSECIPFNQWYLRLKKLIQYKLKIQQIIQ